MFSPSQKKDTGGGYGGMYKFRYRDQTMNYTNKFILNVSFFIAPC